MYFEDEGWAVFNSGPETRVERIDELDILPDDTSAWECLIRGVIRSSPRHIEALKRVTANPEEFQLILDTAGPSLAKMLEERIA